MPPAWMQRRPTAMLFRKRWSRPHFSRQTATNAECQVVSYWRGRKENGLSRAGAPARRMERQAPARSRAVGKRGLKNMSRPSCTVDEMSLTTREQKEIWDSLLAADYRARYFGELASRFENRETALKLGVAVLSSGAAVTLVTTLETATSLPFLAELFALAAAAVGWVLQRPVQIERFTAQAMV